MYTKKNIVKQLVPYAEKWVMQNDRDLFRPFFEVAEKFCVENRGLIGGAVGIGLLTGRPYAHNVFIYEIFIEEPWMNVRKLADQLYATHAPHIDKRTIQVITEVKNAEFVIFIDVRRAFKVYRLESYRGVPTGELVPPARAKGYFIAGEVPLITADLQLITIYRRLYTPYVPSKRWYKYTELIEIEGILFKAFTTGFSHTRIVERRPPFNESNSRVTATPTFVKGGEEEKKEPIITEERVESDPDSDWIVSTDVALDGGEEDSDHTPGTPTEEDDDGADALSVPDFNQSFGQVFSPEFLLGGRDRGHRHREREHHGRDREHHHNDHGGGDMEAVAVDLVLKWLHCPKRSEVWPEDTVVIGDYALDLMGGAGTVVSLGGPLRFRPRQRLQIIAAKDVGKIIEEIREVLGARRDLVLTHAEFGLNIPNDFQVRKSTLYVTSKNTQRTLPFMDIFNSASFELIPARVLSGYTVGGEWVLCRFLLIDIWNLRLIYNLKRSEALEERIGSNFEKLTSLRKGIYEALVKNAGALFPAEAARYVGRYTDEDVVKSSALRQSKFRFTPYSPYLERSKEGRATGKEEDSSESAKD